MNTIIGTVYKVLPLEMGRSEHGDWQRRTVIIATIAEYSGAQRLMAMQFTGDRVMMCEGFRYGQTLQITFVPESRTFNGEKWYTNLRVVRCDILQPQNTRQ
ncbi:MAG: DUF3127 domain-containing protein [Bacteroidales bacterium]|nr:DUF3127 domain-containing protein [Bacteroidales bacterium]